MASEPPDDVLHFRGKTLTPESPRPLHFPEPSNIPVLENQMDPIFNDTSTYENLPRTTQAVSDLAKVGDTAHLMEQYARIYSLLGERNDKVADASDQDKGTGSFPASDQAEPQGAKNEFSIAALQSLLPASQISSTVTATSAQDTSASAPSSANRPLNHADPFESSPREPRPPSTSTGPSDLTHSGLSREDQSRPNSDQAILNDSENGINYQTLLDNLCEPNSTGTHTSDAVATIKSPTADPNPRLSNTESSLSSAYNLPPRPPPQAKPEIHPNSSPTDDIRSFHDLPALNGVSQPSQSNLHESTSLQSNGSDTSALPSAQTGLPSLLALFHQPNSPSFQSTKEADGAASHAPRSGVPEPHTSKTQEDRDDEAPWGPETQKKYDEFLHDERVYVTEGVWDRFAPGSRLFVGNLPSERVTKRDLFHLFHKYGKLAQISIKPAYGFVQFMDATSCRNALEAEQGGVIRGRKIRLLTTVDLEISKPQRSSRNAPEPSKPSGLRRSRSPDYSRNRDVGRGGRLGSERYDRVAGDRKSSVNEGRDYGDHRHRDNYRPTWSPVRGSRREGYRSRDRSVERYDHRSRRRSRSPYGPGTRYRSPTPRGPSYDSDSELPIPRRAPRHVPDVQIIVLENVDNEFVYRIETAFRDRGLRTDVLILSPRISLPAVIRRQILEGVLVIVKLSKTNQYSGRIPLQVFDRGGGADNVRFNEYAGLEPKVAAEVAIHARNIPIGTSNQGAMQQGLGTQAAGPPQSSLGPQSNVANLISSLDAPALQSLLSALQQNPTALSQQQYPPSTLPAANVANLLSNITRNNNSGLSVLPPSQNPAPVQSFGQPPAHTALEAETNLAALLAKGQLPSGPSQTQYINEQLAKWKR
ncbi:RNA-binding protein [Coccidioides immitis RS]|uniref:RNA-binding protein n=1 Tax=Coccidioides immitis (strain RS) TaxID=246410 RepID=J3KK95_COCIM|nr:RNA-binding protein [Coccidioides immitis RS]EAS36577.3 RNA-binding protein [Coccidioides immitis RS]